MVLHIPLCVILHPDFKYGLGDVVEEVNSQEDVVEIWGESWEDDDIYTESAKIDDDIRLPELHQH